MACTQIIIEIIIYSTKIKSVPESHSSTCSPNCYKGIYDKPVYLILKPVKPKEPEILYIKEGLKAYRPKDKTKLFDVIGKAVGIIFSKFDFPDDKYPHIDKYVKGLDLVKDIPYVLITNEEGLAEVNRQEKYDKVAEMEISSEGLITRVVDTHRVEVEEKPNEKLYGRKIEPLVKEEENSFPRTGKLPISLFNLLRYLSFLSSLKSKFENSQYKPFYSQKLLYNLLKFLSRPSDDTSKYLSQYDEKFLLENFLNSSKDQDLDYDLPKFWDDSFKQESMNMNYYPGHNSKNWYPLSGYELFNKDFGYFPKNWYSEPSYESYMNNLNGISNYPVGSSSYGFNSVNSLADKLPNPWFEGYETVNQKPYYNLPYGDLESNRRKFTNLDFNPMLYSSHHIFPSGLSYGSNPKYPPNMSSQVQFWQSPSHSLNYPYYSPAGPHSYSSSNLPYSFKPQYSDLSQPGKPYIPLKYSTPYFHPGSTYVFNVCQGQQPYYYYPEVEAASEDHGPIMSSSSYHPSKPNDVRSAHMPFNSEQIANTIPNLTSSKMTVSPSEEFYRRLEPKISFKNVLYTPNTDESDSMRFVGHSKHENGKYNRPIHLYSQNHIFPKPNNNLKHPPPDSIPSGFISASQP